MTHDCKRDGCLEGKPFKHWQVLTIAVKPGWYKYSITGINHHNGQPFAWAVPDLNDEQYDLSSVQPSRL